MVLKLHRYVFSQFHSFFGSDEQQVGSHILSSYQVETRLHGGAQVGFMDVYVPVSCSERMGFYEGMSFTSMQNSAY